MSAAAVVAGVVAVLGSGESEVAVLVQSGRVERASWLVENQFLKQSFTQQQNK